MPRWYNLAINSGSIFVCYQYLICCVGSAITFRENESEELHCIVFRNPLAHVQTFFLTTSISAIKDARKTYAIFTECAKISKKEFVFINRSALEWGKKLDEFWIELWAWMSFITETRRQKKQHLNNTKKIIQLSLSPKNVLKLEGIVPSPQDTLKVNHILTCFTYIFYY